jgi:hypothetical protein
MGCERIICYLCTEKSLTGGANRVLVDVIDLGKKPQAFYQTANEVLDAWRDTEAYRDLTKEQLFGEGAVMEPADALEARDQAREDAKTAI